MAAIADVTGHRTEPPRKAAAAGTSGLLRQMRRGTRLERGFPMALPMAGGRP